MISIIEDIYSASPSSLSTLHGCPGDFQHRLTFYTYQEAFFYILIAPGELPNLKIGSLAEYEAPDSYTNSYLIAETVNMSVATSPCDLKAVPNIIDDITSLGSTFASGDMTDTAARLALLERARSLVRALETPRETMIKHCWAQVRDPR